MRVTHSHERLTGFSRAETRDEQYLSSPVCQVPVIPAGGCTKAPNSEPLSKKGDFFYPSRGVRSASLGLASPEGLPAAEAPVSGLPQWLSQEASQPSHPQSTSPSPHHLSH